MELVDTHCHIQSSGLLAGGEDNTQRLWQKAGSPSGPQLVKSARDAGVTRLICVGCTPADSELAVDFANVNEACWASVGIHPHEARQFVGDDKTLERFADLAKRPRVVAIGECGLDFYYNHSSKADQIKIFEFQLQLAQRCGLPLIFHVREAFADFWPIFDRYKLRGVLHSFTDSKENLDKAVERGLFIGVNGIATFAKDPKQLEVYREVPLQNLLLETDSPFLTPVPYRGSINEPKRVGAVADFLAKLRGENRETLAGVTTDNARNLFGL